MTDAITHKHTDRLCLRRPTPADAEAVGQIQGDPAMNAFNPSGGERPCFARRLGC
jgi:hypothetical protein